MKNIEMSILLQGRIQNKMKCTFLCTSLVRDGFKKKEKKLMEFSIKGPDSPDPASQPLNEKKN